MKTEESNLYNMNNEPITSTHKTPVRLLFLVLEHTNYDIKKTTSEDYFSLEAVALYSEERLKLYIEKANECNTNYEMNDVEKFRLCVYEINQHIFNFKKAIKII